MLILMIFVVLIFTIFLFSNSGRIILVMEYVL